ncbi:hypothetical protein HN51_050630, partial [Arachis hypogaea]
MLSVSVADCESFSSTTFVCLALFSGGVLVAESEPTSHHHAVKVPHFLVDTNPPPRRGHAESQSPPPRSEGLPPMFYHRRPSHSSLFCFTAFASPPLFVAIVLHCRSASILPCSPRTNSSEDCSLFVDYGMKICPRIHVVIIMRVAMTHPMAVTNCNIDMESLISDQNRSIATLSITTLLKTGNESSVEGLMKQITNFMSDIADEFKIVVVEAMRSLCL